MPQLIDIEGFGTVEFPDDASPEQIKQALDTYVTPRVRATLTERADRIERGRQAEGYEPPSVFRSALESAGSQVADVFRRLPEGAATGSARTLEGAARAADIAGDTPTIPYMGGFGSDRAAQTQADINRQILAANEKRAATRQQRVEESPAYQFGAQTAEAAKEFYGVDRARDQEFVGQLATAAGEMLPTLAAGLVPGVGPLTAGAQYALSAGESQAKEAIEAGRPDVADIAFISAAGLGGLTEAAFGVPGRLLSIANRARKAGVNPSRFGQWAKSNPVAAGIARAAGEGAVREGAQEGLEQLGSNLIASDVAGYDPTRPLGENVGQAVALGAALGGLIGGGASAVQQASRNLTAAQRYAARREQAAQDLAAQQQQVQDNLAKIKAEAERLAQRSGALPPTLPASPTPSAPTTATRGPTGAPAPTVDAPLAGESPLPPAAPALPPPFKSRELPQVLDARELGGTPQEAAEALGAIFSRSFPDAAPPDLTALRYAIEDGQVLASVQDGKPTGYSLLDTFVSPRNRKPQGVLKWLITDPSSRGTGSGQALMDASAKWFSRQGISSARIEPSFGSAPFYNRYFQTAGFSGRPFVDIEVSKWLGRVAPRGAAKPPTPAAPKPPTPKTAAQLDSNLWNAWQSLPESGMDPNADRAYATEAAKVDKATRNRFFAHGLRGFDEKVLASILKEGLKQGGEGPPLSASVSGANTFDTEPLILLSKPGQTIANGGVGAVVVNRPWADQLIPTLQARYPGVTFLSPSRVAEYLSQPPTPTPAPQPRVTTLPAELSKAKPRYSYGEKKFLPTFASDIDLALYTVAQKTTSKRDADYLKFLVDSLGLPEKEVRALGTRFRDDVIKPLAARAEGGTAAKPAPLSIPPFYSAKPPTPAPNAPAAVRQQPGVPVQPAQAPQGGVSPKAGAGDRAVGAKAKPAAKESAVADELDRLETIESVGQLSAKQAKRLAELRAKAAAQPAPAQPVAQPAPAQPAPVQPVAQPVSPAQEFEAALGLMKANGDLQAVETFQKLRKDWRLIAGRPSIDALANLATLYAAGGLDTPISNIALLMGLDSVPKLRVLAVDSPDLSAWGDTSPKTGGLLVQGEQIYLDPFAYYKSLVLPDQTLLFKTVAHELWHVVLDRVTMRMSGGDRAKQKELYQKLYDAVPPEFKAVAARTAWGYSQDVVVDEFLRAVLEKNASPLLKNFADLIDDPKILEALAKAQTTEEISLVRSPQLLEALTKSVVDFDLTDSKVLGKLKPGIFAGIKQAFVDLLNAIKGTRREAGDPLVQVIDAALKAAKVEAPRNRLKAAKVREAKAAAPAPVKVPRKVEKATSEFEQLPNWAGASPEARQAYQYLATRSGKGGRPSTDPERAAESQEAAMLLKQTAYVGVMRDFDARATQKLKDAYTNFIRQLTSSQDADELDRLTPAARQDFDSALARELFRRQDYQADKLSDEFIKAARIALNAKLRGSQDSMVPVGESIERAVGEDLAPSAGDDLGTSALAAGPSPGAPLTEVNLQIKNAYELLALVSDLSTATAEEKAKVAPLIELIRQNLDFELTSDKIRAVLGREFPVEMSPEAQKLYGLGFQLLPLQLQAEALQVQLDRARSKKDKADLTKNLGLVTNQLTALVEALRRTVPNPVHLQTLLTYIMNVREGGRPAAPPAQATQAVRYSLPVALPNDLFSTPPSENDALAALYEDKSPLWGAHRGLKAGTPVGVRIDIPAYLRRGVFVQTVHKPATPGNVGDRIGYDNLIRLSGPVRFFVKEGSPEIKSGALAIKEGRAKKHPIATVEGNYSRDRSIPRDINSWTPVGMNPVKHSYFYDKRTGEPVVGGSESYSVGNTVFVKDPVYGVKSDFRYSLPVAQGDEEYLRLAQDPVGNREALQRMVDEAARKAGYTVGPVWHGTPFGNFNERAKSVNAERGRLLALQTKARAQFYAASDLLTEVKLGRGRYEYEDRKTATDLFNEAKRDLESIERALPLEAPTGDVFRYVQAVDHGYLGQGFYFTYSKDEASGYARFPHRPRVAGDLGPYVYKAFLKVTNPYKAGDPINSPMTDANADYRRQYVRDVESRLRLDSAILTERIRESGYDGVVGNYGETDEVVVFDPTQIKSADPVTYDDNGNVIPLSQRFQPTEPDIRYSLPVAQGDEDLGAAETRLRGAATSQSLNTLTEALAQGLNLVDRRLSDTDQERLQQTRLSAYRQSLRDAMAIINNRLSDQGAEEAISLGDEDAFEAAIENPEIRASLDRANQPANDALRQLRQEVLAEQQAQQQVRDTLRLAELQAVYEVLSQNSAHAKLAKRVDRKIKSLENSLGDPTPRTRELLAYRAAEVDRAAAARANASAPLRWLRTLGKFATSDSPVNALPLSARSPEEINRALDAWDQEGTGFGEPSLDPDMIQEGLSPQEQQFVLRARASQWGSEAEAMRLQAQRFFFSFDNLRRQAFRTLQEKGAELHKDIARISRDLIQAKAEMSQKQLDLREALQLAQRDLPDIPADQRDFLLQHETAINTIAERYAALLNDPDAGARAAQVLGFFTSPLAGEGSATQIKALASELRVGDAVFARLADIISRSPAARGVLLDYLNRVEVEGLLPRLQRLQAAANNPALDNPDAFDPASPNYREARAAYQDAMAARDGVMADVVGGLRSGIASGASTVSKLINQLRSRSVDLRALEQTSEVFENIAANPQFQAARSDLDQGVFSLPQLIAHNADGKLEFRAFGMKDPQTGEPGPIYHAGFAVDPSDYNRTKVANQVRGYVAKLVEYRNAFAHARLNYTANAGPPPSQLGFDSPTLTAVETALTEDSALYSNLYLTSPELVSGAEGAASRFIPGWTYLQRLQIPGLGPVLSLLSKVEPGPLATKAAGFFGALLRPATGNLTRALQDIEGELTSAYDPTNPDKGLSHLRRKAVLSHTNNPAEVGLPPIQDFDTYRREVFNFIAALGLSPNPKLLKVGLFIDKSGRIITQEDLDFLKAESDFNTKVYAKMQRRADRAIVEKHGESFFSRFAQSPAKFKANRFGNERMGQFVEAAAKLDADKSLLSGSPEAFEFWNSPEALSQAVAHVTGAVFDRANDAVTYRASMREAQEQLATRAMQGQDTLRDVTSIDELAAKIAAMPAARGLLPAQVREGLYHELDQLTRNARQMAQDLRVDGGNLLNDVKLDWIKLRRLSADNQFANPWGPRKLPYDLYDYGLLTDGDAHRFTRNAVHREMVDYGLALDSALKEVNALIKAQEEARRTGTTSPAFEETFTSMSEALTYQMQLGQMQALYADWVSGFRPRRWLDLVTGGVDLVTQAVLAPVTVTLRNLFYGSGMAHVAFNRRDLGQMKGGAAGTTAKFFIRSTGEFGKNLISTAILTAAKRARISNPHIPLGKVERWAARARERNTVLRGLGGSSRTTLITDIRRGYEALKIKDTPEGRTYVLPERYADLEVWVGTALVAAKATLKKVGTMAADAPLNMSALVTADALEQDYMAVADRYYDRLVKEGLLDPDSLRASVDRFLATRDPKMVVKASDFSDQFTLVNNEARLQDLRRNFEFIGKPLDDLFLDWIVRRAQDPDAMLFLPQHRRAYLQALIQDVNAPNFANRPLSFATNKELAMTYRLMGYGINAGWALAEFPVRVRRTLQMRKQGLGKGKYEGPWVVDASSMAWATSTALAFMIVGALGTGAAELYRRLLQRAEKSRDTVFDPDLWTSGDMQRWTRTLVRDGIAAFPVPLVPEFFNLFLNVDPFGKGFDPAGASFVGSVLQAIVSEAVTAGTTIRAFVKGETLDDAIARTTRQAVNIVSRYGPGAKELYAWLGAAGIDYFEGRQKALQERSAERFALSLNPDLARRGGAASSARAALTMSPSREPVRMLVEAAKTGNTEQYQQAMRMLQVDWQSRNKENAEAGRKLIEWDDYLRSVTETSIPFRTSAQRRPTEAETANMLAAMTPDQRQRVAEQVAAVEAIRGTPVTISSREASSGGGGGGGGGALPTSSLRLPGIGRVSVGGGGGGGGSRLSRSRRRRPRLTLGGRGRNLSRLRVRRLRSPRNRLLRRRRA